MGASEISIRARERIGLDLCLIALLVREKRTPSQPDLVSRIVFTVEHFCVVAIPNKGTERCAGECITKIITLLFLFVRSEILSSSSIYLPCVLKAGLSVSSTLAQFKQAPVILISMGQKIEQWRIE